MSMVKKAFLTLTVVVANVLLFAPAVFAQAGGDNGASWGWAAALAAGLGMGLAAFGGALGQARAAAAALEGIARNPGAADKIFTPLILGLALIESLVIYALLISFFLLGKFGA